ELKLGLKVLTEAWSGDLDGMIQRRVIRVLTVYGLGRYFIEDAREQGFAVETMKAFEATLNKDRKSYEHVHVVFIPVSRDQLLPGLLEGRGDIIVAGWTITPERQQQVDFTIPISKPLKEILVTGPSAPPINSLEDLAGKTIHVRESSSYFSSLQETSDKFQAAGLEPIDIQPISELLEDEDLLEMVSGGLLPWLVVDDFKADVFKGVFPKLVLRSDLVLREGGQIAYAFRKGSPQFAEALNAHLKNYRQGSLQGNILFNRYVRDYEWVDNALDTEDYGRFEAVASLFGKYGEQYGVDALLVAAQGYQESKLDQSVRSHAGAVGIMQLLPSTAADSKVGIPDISNAENNIHAGIKYLDFIRSEYFPDLAHDRLNQTLLAMASYNAGPNKIRELRKKAADQGLDPDRWFGNVEVVAAKEVGREPVQYVANIYKYYVAYRLSMAQMTQRHQERKREGLD
ncbi:MAG TPA: lytic transglycosylase F, partial [Xanthomonadales bacterium]|nr:lytic transglycosylase F [Xanthomonadales bacterium]